MKLTFSSFILLLSFSSGAFAAGSTVQFSHDNTKDRHELTGMHQRSTVSKGYQKRVIKLRAKPTKSKQHSLRDPYNDPAFLKRELYR